MLAPEFEPLKVKSIAKSERPAKSVELLGLSLRTGALGAAFDDILKILDNAIAFDSNCWNAHAEKSAILRTSTDKHKEALVSAAKATRVKKALSLPKSDKEQDINKSIAGAIDALTKPDVSLFGLYNQLVLEQVALHEKVKPAKKDTETKHILITSAFNAAMQKLLAVKATSLLDHEAQAYAAAKVSGMEVLYDKLIAITEIAEYSDNIRIYIAAGACADTDAQKEHCYTEAVRCEDKYTKGHYELGLIHFNREEIPQAEVHFKKIVEIDNSHVEAMLYVIITTGTQGNHEDSIKYAEMLLKAEHTVEQASQAYHGVTIACKKTGDYTKALQSINKALELEPDDIFYLCSKADLLTMQGPDADRDREALELVNKAHEIYKVKKSEGTLEHLSVKNLTFIEWAFSDQREMLLKTVNDFEQAEVTVEGSDEMAVLLHGQKEDMLQKALASFSDQGQGQTEMEHLKVMMGCMKDMFTRVKELEVQTAEVRQVKEWKAVIVDNPEVHGWYKGFVSTLETHYIESKLVTKAGGSNLQIDASNWVMSALSSAVSVLPFGSFLGAGMQALTEKVQAASITRKAVKVASIAPTIGDFDDMIVGAALKQGVINQAKVLDHIQDQVVQEKSSGILAKIAGHCKKLAGKFQGALFEKPEEKVGVVDAWALIHAVEQQGELVDPAQLLENQLGALVENKGNCMLHELQTLGDAFNLLMLEGTN